MTIKTYPISIGAHEAIDFRANESQFALVHKTKASTGDTCKTIIMNKREALILYQALQEEILKEKGDKR